MDLNEALNFIQSNLSKSTKSKHFEDMCMERNINFIPEKIIGIVHQDSNIYKVWLEYTKDKDLNIILSVNKTIKLITIFPVDIRRRKR